MEGMEKEGGGEWGGGGWFFFFKQKTAYEIYQCDWSSDVCSSDLEQLDTLGAPLGFFIKLSLFK